MHIPSIVLVLGIVLGILAASVTVPTAMLAADIIRPPVAYGPVR